MSERDEDYPRQARALSEDAFVARYPGPFLLYEADPALVARGFHTALGRVETPGKDKAEPEASKWSAVPISKRPGGLYPERIFVGRTRRSDVPIAHERVSKTHAYFTVAEGGYAISDAGSSNGTLVGGRRLEKNEARVVHDGDEIGLGPVVVLFCDARRAYRLLRQSGPVP